MIPPVPSPQAFVPAQIPEPQSPSVVEADDPVEEVVPAATRRARTTAAVAAPEATTADTPTTDEAFVQEDTTFIPPVVDFEPADEAVMDETQLSTAPSASDLAGYAFLVLVVLAAIAFLVLRRRKPRRLARTIKPLPVERREPAPIAPAVVQSTAVDVPSPVVTAPPAIAVHSQSFVPQSVYRRPAGTGPAVDLPRSVPTDFAERDALLKRMIAARPDRANPFRSPKQRVNRARLILQSIGRKFKNVDPWIDLSDYPQVWPELARRKILQAA